MEFVSVRELSSHTSKIIRSAKPTIIVNHSKPAAVLIPWADFINSASPELEKAVRWAAIDSLSSKVQKELTEKGITEQEVVDDFAAFRETHRRRQRPKSGDDGQ